MGLERPLALWRLWLGLGLEPPVARRLGLGLEQLGLGLEQLGLGLEQLGLGRLLGLEWWLLGLPGTLWPLLGQQLLQQCLGL